MTTLQVQYLLAYLGYDPGPLDGILGNTTMGAVRSFQRDFTGIQVDGGPGKETQKALRHAVAYGMPTRDKPSTSGTPPDKTGTFWDEIKYFDPEEANICCPCPRCVGKREYPTEKLMRTADSIREELGPMIPSSVRRCQEHNGELKGSAPNSRHIIGKAMDFSCPNSSQAKTEACLARKKAAGEIHYWYPMGSGWYHFDID